MSADAQTPPVMFTPGLRTEDAVGNYWLYQVTYRLRREICWLWHERGTLAGSPRGTLPPFSDRLASTLDLARYEREKQVFFAENDTARYLTSLLETPPPDERTPVQGSFAWVAQELALSLASRFVLALALLPIVDSAAGTVMAACVNDGHRAAPTLGLAQRLWLNPAELLPLADASHPLFRYGLLRANSGGAADGHALDWEAALAVPALCARVLLFHATNWPEEFAKVDPEGDLAITTQPAIDQVAARLRSDPRPALRIVPLVGPKGAPFAAIAAQIAAANGRTVARVESRRLGSEASLNSAATLAWLHGRDLFIAAPDRIAGANDDRHAPPLLDVTADLPVTLFVGMDDKALVQRLPASRTLTPVLVSPMTFHARQDRWRQQLGRTGAKAALNPAIAECARRFRFEQETIDNVARSVRARKAAPDAKELAEACRAEATVDIGELAQLVQARFTLSELMLPPKQAHEIRSIIKAMRALTRVHYEWGTAQAWNESGLCALFAGPPGTGKTMAAEVIAADLQLPMYRIDLSQVVNKYIGETEKNLRRLFDAAEASDVILFFDEADALFGKRSEVKDAHDRYANLEISYLLERMERFKGLGILATNRKQDLDEAFLRRLRFVIDFPLPGEDERRHIWQQMIPPGVTAKGLDFDFLARQFPLAGGHIRSIIFQACLQTAGSAKTRVLTMPPIIAAIKTEYEKLNRSFSSEQFAPYDDSTSGHS